MSVVRGQATMRFLAAQAGTQTPPCSVECYTCPTGTRKDNEQLQALGGRAVAEALVVSEVTG